MADRNRMDEQSPAKSATPAGNDSPPSERPDDGIEKNPEPDSEESGPSRPRGHTEEPDRTL
jgi:hypothetical protein